MTEKLLRHYILEYCTLINKYPNKLHHGNNDGNCVQHQSFIFSQDHEPDLISHFIPSFISNFISNNEMKYHFELKYTYRKDYKPKLQCSNQIQSSEPISFVVRQANGKHMDWPVENKTWEYHFFKGILSELDKFFKAARNSTDNYLQHQETIHKQNDPKYQEINYDYIYYRKVNPLRDYCKEQQHDLMGGNYSSLAITKENFERFTSEFCVLINDSNALESLARSETFKKTVSGYTRGITPITQNTPISEDFTIKLDDTTYPFKLRYICGNDCSKNSNISYIELYPYNFEGSSLKFTINNTDKNFRLFMDMRDNLREISKKEKYYLSDQKRELIKKSCNKFEKDLPTRIEKKHKKTELNITDNKNFNSTINQIQSSNKKNNHEVTLASVVNKITSSNRENGIVPGYYVNNIIRNNSQFNYSLYSDILKARPPLIAESTDTSWLIPLIAVGGIICLAVIGAFSAFQMKRSRNINNQMQYAKEHIPFSERRNSEEKYSFVQVEDYSLCRGRSSISLLKSRRYHLSSPESIEKLNTEQKLPNGIILDPNQESCAFIIHPSSEV